MRYFIIINPPEYRANDEDEGGYAWAGEAADEAAAFEAACDACEETNGWGKYDDPALAEHSAIDREDTHIIECGPDYQFMVEALAPVVRELLAYEAAAFDADEEVEGGDLVEAFAEWRPRLKAALGEG